MKKGEKVMKVEYCDKCGKQSMFKRHLGLGTLFVIVLTGGFWLLLIPFYPIRCVGCGTQWQAQKGKFSWR